MASNIEGWTKWDERGMMLRRGWVGAFFLHFFAVGTALAVYDYGMPDWAYAFAALLFVAGLLLPFLREWTRVDPESRSLVRTWGIVVPMRSRRLPVDLTKVHEVRLVEEHYTVSADYMRIHGTAPKVKRVAHIVRLEGASPPTDFRNASPGLMRWFAEHCGRALGVPVRSESNAPPASPRAPA